MIGLGQFNTEAQLDMAVLILRLVMQNIMDFLTKSTMQLDNLNAMAEIRIFLAIGQGLITLYNITQTQHVEALQYT